MMVYILFFTGFIILISGAHLLIKGASSLGVKLGLSQLVIGMTIVALGTSLPELIINVFASIKGSTGLAIGNVIGSNITNTLLIVGAAALILPLKVNEIVVKRDMWINLVAVVLLFMLANDHLFGRTEERINVTDGVLMLVFFGYYVYLSFYQSKPKAKGSDDKKLKQVSVLLSVLFTAAGIAGLYFGGKWIVAGVQQISMDMGISESALGLTLVAGATSLPELVTSVIAAYRKQVDMAIGNVIGSNIYNLFLVLGVSAVITPIEFERSLNVQIYLLTATSLFLILFIKIGKPSKTISRIEGVVLILLYICFLYISI